MAVKALAPIRTIEALHGPGEVIKGLPQEEEARLVNLGVAEIVAPPKKRSKKSKGKNTK